MLRNFYIFGLKWLTHYLNYNNMCSGENDTLVAYPSQLLMKWVRNQGMVTCIVQSSA